MTGHYSFETFSSLSVKMRDWDLFSPLYFLTSNLITSHLKRKDGNFFFLAKYFCIMCEQASVCVAHLNIRCVSLAVPPGPGH